MDNILFRFLFLTSLLAEYLLGKNTLRSKRDNSNNVLGDIETDFLKIFTDIKQIRSNVPNYGAGNVTFEPEAAHVLLQEPNNYKRTNIINPRDELRDKLDSEFLSTPFASEMLTDFQARHSDPLHKRHGVGEGLASLPDTTNADKDEHLLLSAFSKLDDSGKENTVKENEESDTNNKNKLPELPNDTVLKVVKTAPANDTGDKVNASSKKTLQDGDTLIHSDTFEGKNENTSHILSSTNEGKTNKTSETGDKLAKDDEKVTTSETKEKIAKNDEKVITSETKEKIAKNDEKVMKSETNDDKVSANATEVQSANATTKINRTLEKIKGLEVQIKSIMDEHASNVTNISNDTSKHNASKRDGVTDYMRNMIFESKIKGFLGKLDTFKFSDIGSQKKDEDEFKLQKHANLSDTRSKVLNNSISLVKEEDKTIVAHKAADIKGGSNERTSRVLHLPPLINGSEADSPSSSIKKETISAAFEPECSDSKKCPAGKYCLHFECFDCHHKHHECVAHEQCCSGQFCIYGRCDQKKNIAPGSICKYDSDCGAGCCVLEPTINVETGICKIKLSEYHQCSPVLYRKVWVGDKKPTCGPCDDGLECVNKGVIATHLVCMKAAKAV